MTVFEGEHKSFPGNIRRPSDMECVRFSFEIVFFLKFIIESLFIYCNDDDSIFW